MLGDIPSPLLGTDIMLGGYSPLPWLGADLKEDNLVPRVFSLPRKGDTPSDESIKAVLDNVMERGYPLSNVLSLLLGQPIGPIKGLYLEYLDHYGSVNLHI